MEFFEEENLLRRSNYVLNGHYVFLVAGQCLSLTLTGHVNDLPILLMASPSQRQTFLEQRSHQHERRVGTYDEPSEPHPSESFADCYKFLPGLGTYVPHMFSPPGRGGSTP